jgi:transglutaminase-like putative cysteine protease
MKGPDAGATRARWARLALQLSRDKADTLLLLASALLVLAPHASHLPAWVSAICGTTLLWRAAITLRGTRMPPSALLLPVAIAAMGGVYFTYHTLLGRDAGVAMLVLLVAFKMLEMHARRDLFVVIFLCFFLVLTNFFYSQSIGTALLMVASIVALLTAQLSFQFTGAVPPLRRRLLLGARIFGLAAPLAMILFFVFPRIQGPLWGLPGDANSGRSGLSTSMAPGNLSQLAQSDETAFRVKFIDPAPAQAQLYWRGIVLGVFDGRTWTQVRPQGRRSRAPESISIAVRGAPIRHQVTLEPSANRWLFALELPQQLPRIADNPSDVSAELEMSAAYPIDQRVRYQVASYLDFSLQAEPQLANAQQWLMLPWGFNPHALRAGGALRKEPDPVKRVVTVLQQFARERYVYTLEPPLLGRDSVDEFLYATKAGFCEHYAGAFVFLMRAAGVPARVVTGYQGGELNPVDGFLTVRQADAHAWAEVWLAGRGWIRVDPTAAVAPERVQRSLARALPRKAPFGIEGLAGLINFEPGANSWLARLRFQLSALNNGWNQWVLNYTPERQRGFMDTLRSTLTNWRTLAALALIAGALMAARVLRARRRIDPVDALYSAFCLQLGRRGMVRARDEGPSAYALRLATLDLARDKKAAAAQFLRLYSAHKYGAQAPDPALLATLKRLLTESR